MTDMVTVTSTVPPSLRVPVTYTLFGGYRRWTRRWWADLGRWVTHYWWQDLYTFYHRGRYGWAPRDTWSLDQYLTGVLSGSLSHLADTSHGTPSSYPYISPRVRVAGTDVLRLFDPTTDAWDDVVCDHDQWKADLRRWAQAHHDLTTKWDDYPGYDADDYTAMNAECARRERVAKDARRDLLVWWSSLWS